MAAVVWYNPRFESPGNLEEIVYRLGKEQPDALADFGSDEIAEKRSALWQFCRGPAAVLVISSLLYLLLQKTRFGFTDSFLLEFLSRASIVLIATMGASIVFSLVAFGGFVETTRLYWRGVANAAQAAPSYKEFQDMVNGPA